MLRASSLRVIIISILLIIEGCSSGKQSASYRNTKKSINTLAILTPHTFVEAIDNRIGTPDSSAANALTTKVTNIVTTTLKGKYNLEKEPFELFLIDDKRITLFFNKLDSLKNELPELEIPTWMHPSSSNSNRYILASFIYGFYHVGYNPNYAMKQGIGTETVRLNQPKLTGISIKILVADRQTNKILFYNSDKSFQLDPRIPSHVETMVKKLIVPLYYK